MTDYYNKAIEKNRTKKHRNTALFAVISQKHIQNTPK